MPADRKADRKPRRNRDARDSALAIGLMSGTSADGIDGVLLSLESSGPIAIQATVHAAFPAALQKQINAVIGEPTIDTDTLGQLDSRLGDLYAQTANRLKVKANAAVAVIGCHGQTIRHRPGGKFPFTLQLGNGALIAQRTGLPVVTDFRSADMAAGGQGAPLAPAFHHAVFASRDETRAVLNLGGIANLTHLPADDQAATTGFDTGPANTLLDHWCRRHFNAPFDDHGARAAAGVVQQKLLDKLLAGPVLRPPAAQEHRPRILQPGVARANTRRCKFRRPRARGRPGHPDRAHRRDRGRPTQRTDARR